VFNQSLVLSGAQPPQVLLDGMLRAAEQIRQMSPA
jgi:hypothetical protein